MGTELPRNFYAGNGQLQLGVVLVFLRIVHLTINPTHQVQSSWRSKNCQCLEPPCPLSMSILTKRRKSNNQQKVNCLKNWDIDSWQLNLENGDDILYFTLLWNVTSSSKWSRSYDNNRMQNVNLNTPITVKVIHFSLNDTTYSYTSKAKSQKTISNNNCIIVKQM